MATKLITGGAGFFGTHLARRLMRHDDVRILDMREPTTDAEFIRGDVRDNAVIGKALQAVDTVFHLAARLPQSKVGDRELFSVNCDGTAAVLAAAERRNVRVVHISSSSVFGIPTKVPYTEDDEKNPIGAYGRSKLAAEQLCREYAANGGDIAVLRPMTIVGPGIYGVFRLCLQFIMRDLPIPILGAGENRLQMVSVHDMVDACVRAEKRGNGMLFNIGSDDVPTMNTMFHDVIRHVDSRSMLVHLPAPVFRRVFMAMRALRVSPLVPEHYHLMDKNFILDTARAKRTLGWKPKLDNTQMILDTYRADFQRRQPAL